MVQKIILGDQNKSNLYAGQFDISDEGKLITLKIEEENISIDLKTAVNSTNETLAKLSVDDIKEICKSSNLKVTFFPNGNSRFHKLDSSDDELKNCYALHI